MFHILNLTYIILGRLYAQYINKAITPLLQEGEEEIEVEDEDPEAEEDNEEEEEEENEYEGEDEDDGEDIRMNVGSDGECDELDDLPSSRGNQWKGPISRKASQTSVYLQEWDIPFEQLDLGELIGKVRGLTQTLTVRVSYSKKALLLKLLFVRAGPLGQGAQGSVAWRGRYPTSWDWWEQSGPSEALQKGGDELQTD